MKKSVNTLSSGSTKDYTDLIDFVPENVKGIIFDYGGTLDSRGDHWSRIILDGWRHAGLNIDIDEFCRAYIHGERYLAYPGVIDPSDTFFEVMLKKIEAESSVLDPVPDGRTCERVARYCYDTARTCTSESKLTLEALSRRWPLVLVSNFYGNLDAVLEDFGLNGYFKAVIESAKVGLSKPDPEIFRLGVEALGLQPEEVLVIGDSMDKDILPAASIGCPTLLIDGRPWPPTSENEAQG